MSVASRGFQPHRRQGRRHGVGRDHRRRQPLHRRGDCGGPELDRRRHRQRRRGGRAGVLRRLGRHDPGGALRGPEQARRRARRARRGAGRARVAERRQATRCSCRGGRRRIRLPPVHGRRRPHAGGPGRRRIRARLDLDDPPRADRRRRPDHAVELPADDGGVEDLARPRGRQHGRAEAVGAHAPDDAADGGDRRGHPARRRAEHRLRLRRSGGRRHLVPPAHPRWCR